MNWHARYVQQAKWTRDLRKYLFKKAGLGLARRVLEVGCGTGAILGEMPNGVPLYGLDLDRAALAGCRTHARSAALIQGDALALPYSDRSFDIVYCHYLLLWVHDPLRALVEMKRVTRAGGHILAFAEPDYSQRIDKPEGLIPLGRWQTESLSRQGADPGLGARLATLFFQARINIIEAGMIQGMHADRSPDEWDDEWSTIESDLAGSVSAEVLRNMKAADQRARASGVREMDIPTYFAWGTS